MPMKHVIDFVQAASPITGSRTKFGGQPNWVTGPQWPLSEETENPMRFIGQIALTQLPGFVTPARMAYLFMTDEEDGDYVDGTWEPGSVPFSVNFGDAGVGYAFMNADGTEAKFLWQCG